VGRLSRAEETRLEILAPESILPVALSRLKETHPYEEVAYDLYPLRHPGTPLGLGRIGSWPAPRPFSQVISTVKKMFRVENLQVWGQPPQEVQRLALCSGSGGDLLQDALNRGAQIYLTGEIRHHQVPAGLLEDFAVVTMGHFSSEVVFMEPWARQLIDLFQESSLELKVLVAANQTPPCRYV
jgi:putative NIF3 family GTP cyclohydrolase 1 type 2